MVKRGPDKDTVRVKEEYKDELISLKESIKAIRVQMATNAVPKKVISTNRSNIWCSRYKDYGHYASECMQPVT